MTRMRVRKKPLTTHWAVAKSVPKAAMRRGMTMLTLVPPKVWVPPAKSTMPATIHL